MRPIYLLRISMRLYHESSEKSKKEKEGVFNSSIDPVGYNRFGPSTRKSYARFLDLAP